MKDKEKTKEKSIEEIELLQGRITGLEKSEFERKKVEELLRESEEKFRLAFENSRDAIFWADPQTGMIINCNKAAEALLEKRKEQIVGKHQTTLHSPEKAEFYGNMFRKHIEQNGAVDDEAEVITKSGKIKPVHISASLTLVGEKPIIQGIFRDITEYKKKEEELRIKDRAIGSSINGIAIADLGGILTYVNRSFVQMWRYDTAGEVLGKSLAKFWEREEKAMEVMKAALDKGELKGEMIGKRKDGSLFCVQVSVSPVPDETGNPIYMMGSFIDVTLWKRAEEELQQEQKMLRTVIDNLPDHIYVKDADGRYIMDNIAHVHFLGARTPAEVVGKTASDYLPPALAEQLRADDRKVIETAQPLISQEGEFEDRSGNKLWLLTTKVPLKNSDGRVVGVVGVCRNITDRKRAEEGLAKERNLLRTVIDNLPDYIYIKDTDSRYIVSSKAHACFLGKETPEEVIGKTVFELFPREMAEQYAADDQRIIQTGQPLLGREERSVDGIGNEVWNLTTKVPLRDGEEKVVGLVGIARDITDRKKVEEALKESEERYRTLVQNVPVAVYRTTPGPKGKFLMGNPTCLKIFGLDSEEELKEIDACDLWMNPEERKVFSDNLLAKGSVDGLELHLRKKDGTPFWGSVTSRVVYDKDGKNPCFDTTIMDITDRKEAEEALKESEEQYRTLVQNVPIGVYRTTPGPKGKILIANPTRVKMFGFDSEEELRKIDVADTYMNPEDRKAFSDNVLAKGSVSGVEQHLRKKDGTPFWGSVTARAVYDENGKNPYFDCTIMDITERKKAEEEKEKIQAELLQVQKMEAIGMLAGGVAHDFNNLLTIIQGCTELAMEKVNEPVPLYGDLNQIRLAAMRAASLTRQLLLFSRRHPIEPTPLNINRTIDSLLKMLNRVIGEDIAIDSDLEPDLWTVWADAGNIEQVIMNLAVNARDAMPKGGKLTIKTENVILSEDYYKAMPEARSGKFVRLWVEDTGFGMDKEIIPRIFEPFFSTKGSGKGIGLGLSVVYGIVKQHEGWINVYSEPGRGSTFKVYLPAFSVKSEDETKKTISLQELKGSGEWILLVEDEEGVRELAALGLRENGYVVFEAANAKEAIDIFEREEGKFHLIFCDVVLPGESGLQLVDQLLPRKPELQVLLSSGYADQKSQMPIIREMGFRFLQKPYALSDMLRAVRGAIEQAK